jgi:methyltransferase (TIGR00027 family)
MTMSELGSARSSDDSWDLATSVGATATLVAACRALASRGPQPLIDDRFAEPLVRAVGHDFFTRLLDGDVQMDEEDAPFNEQHRLEMTAVRTRFFDDFFLDAAAAGLRQAVILAAGLDARSYRLAWPSGAVVFELDLPAVTEFKTLTMAQLGEIPSVDLRAVGIDLRKEWPNALRDIGFDLTQPTAWSAEGLLMYLPPDAQDRLLDQVTALSALGSRFASENITDMRSFADDRTKPSRDRWQRHGLDVDVADLVLDGDRRPAAEYLASAGWQVVGHSMDDLYAANGFTFSDHPAMKSYRETSMFVAELT